MDSYLTRHDAILALIVLGCVFLGAGIYFVLGRAGRPDIYVFEGGRGLCYAGAVFCAIGLAALGVEALVT